MSEVNSFQSMFSPLLSHTKRISGFPIGYEEVRSISNPPADVCLGGGFETVNSIYIYIYIWNDNIQSFDCENNEASIPVFHADWTSVSVPQTSGLRGLDVSFIPPLQTVARPV